LRLASGGASSESACQSRRKDRNNISDSRKRNGDRRRRCWGARPDPDALRTAPRALYPAAHRPLVPSSCADCGISRGSVCEGGRHIEHLREKPRVQHGKQDLRAAIRGGQTYKSLHEHRRSNPSFAAAAHRFLRGAPRRLHRQALRGQGLPIGRAPRGQAGEWTEPGQGESR